VRRRLSITARRRSSCTCQIEDQMCSRTQYAPLCIWKGLPLALHSFQRFFISMASCDGQKMHLDAPAALFRLRSSASVLEVVDTRYSTDVPTQFLPWKSVSWRNCAIASATASRGRLRNAQHHSAGIIDEDRPRNSIYVENRATSRKQHDLLRLPFQGVRPLCSNHHTSA